MLIIMLAAGDVVNEGSFRQQERRYPGFEM